MSQFIALLNASDPDLLSNIENAGGQVVSVSEPGFVVVEGDQAVADSVAALQAVQAVSPVDGSWDTSQLSLGDDVAVLVDAWNTSFSPEYQAALSDPYRAGEPWDFPNGCDPDRMPDGGDGGPLVADSGDGSFTGTGTSDGSSTGTGTGDGTIASSDTPADGGQGGDGGGDGDSGGTDGGADGELG